MLKPYSRNIRKIDNMLRNTYLQDIQLQQLDKILKNCLFRVRNPYKDAFLYQCMHDIDKYCLIVCNYEDMFDTYSTEIEVYSPIYEHDNMFRIEVNSHILSCVASIYNYRFRETCYIIPTNFTSINQVKEILNSED